MNATSLELMGPVSDDRVAGSLLREKMEGRRVSSAASNDMLCYV